MKPQYIKQTVLDAYRQRIAETCSFEVLSPFGMTIDEFKQNGRSVFTEQFHDELAREIRASPVRMQDQILVTGWGLAPASAMIYEVGPAGDFLHSTSGIGVIGSGSPIAQSVLMLLGQGRDRTLAETIFNVAVAKFFSERSTDMNVGRGTTVFIQRKENNSGGGQAGDFLSEEQVGRLRSLWDSHLRLKIPDEAYGEITRMAAEFSGGQITAEGMVPHMNASIRLNRRTNPTG